MKSILQRRERNQWGLDLERQAEIYWLHCLGELNQSAAIIERNFRTRAGEIDWIAEVSGEDSAKAIVFVEVRARSSSLAIESVGTSKLRRIRLASEVFLQSRRVEATEVRFDLVVWEKDGWTWIPVAWEY